MKQLNQMIRIITLPPIVAGTTLALLYFAAGVMTGKELIFSELFLLLIPSAAYPLRALFHIGKDPREGQRKTALICSTFGYAAGFVWSLVVGSSYVVRVLFTAYMISVVLLLLLNLFFHFKASGHACSSTAPAVLLVWQIHPLMVIPCVLLIWAVYSSSLKLERHTLPQLLAGSGISILAMLLGVLFC